MIHFESFTLANGLRVLVHQDRTTQIAVLNLMYDVGSKDEEEEKTGFAHLFEHLMFGGSRHIAKFDEPLQMVGGQNNAFTSSDITNYYLTVPAQNIETGFWLESDRMEGLSFAPATLEVQRKVVIEEFKQRYLNQPYGDTWLKLRPVAYTTHPYRWPTIGKKTDHIAQATMEDVKAFFHKHYTPQNAILALAGNITVSQAKALSEKWFGPIAAGNKHVRQLPQEPKQTAKRTIEVAAPVPANAFYKVFHMPGKFDLGYHATDLLSDVLGRGQSSRLYQRLVKKEAVFHEINCHIMGSVDPGLLVITGKLRKGIGFGQAEESVNEVVASVRDQAVGEEELMKVKNKAETAMAFGETEVLNRAINLCMASLSGDPNYVNEEPKKIRAVTTADIQAAAQQVMREENSTVLYYQSTKQAF